MLLRSHWFVASTYGSVPLICCQYLWSGSMEDLVKDITRLKNRMVGLHLLVSLFEFPIEESAQPGWPNVPVAG